MDGLWPCNNKCHASLQNSIESKKQTNAISVYLTEIQHGFGFKVAQHLCLIFCLLVCLESC